MLSRQVALNRAPIRATSLISKRFVQSSSVLFSQPAQTQVKHQHKSKFYDIKDQIDNFVYFNTVPKKLKPLVYREKNSELLLSMDLHDQKTGRPVKPERFTGVPSVTKFNQFIDNLLLLDELYSVKKTLKELDTKVPDFLKSSTINSYLYKSLEFGKFSGGLDYIYTLANYRKTSFNLKNIEAILLIRSIQIKAQGIADLDWLRYKLRHALKHNKKNLKVDENYEHTSLYKIAHINALLNLRANVPAEETKMLGLINKKIDQFASSLDFEAIKFNKKALEADALKNYSSYEHNYTVLKLFEQTVAKLPELEQANFKPIFTKSAEFFKFVEELQAMAGVSKTLVDRLNASVEIFAKNGEQELAQAPDSAVEEESK